MSYRQPTCRGCGKAIEWAEMKETVNGEVKLKRIPLDPKPPTYQMVDDGYGNLEWRRSSAMVSHFATCTHANKFSSSNTSHQPSLPAQDHVEEEEKWWQR